MSKKGNSAKSCNFRAVIAFRSKVISIARRGGAGELLFRSKVISIVRRGGAGELLFRVKGHCSLLRRGGAGELLFRSKVKSGGENAGLFVPVLIVDWLFRCTVSSKSKPIKEAGFRKKLSFGKYSPRV